MALVWFLSLEREEALPTDNFKKAILLNSLLLNSSTLRRPPEKEDTGDFSS